MIKLSPTTLNLFLECPRCFWLQMNKGIKRPRGIFPSLPGGMDQVIKKYFDKYRKAGMLPPELFANIEGKLFADINTLNKWRNWRASDLIYTDQSINVSLSGALDDCLVDGEYYIPLDYKTRGWPLKENPAIYYQNQLDCYCLMLEAKGYKTKGISYLIYYYPEAVEENGKVKFNVQPFKIETNIATPRENLKKAMEILSRDIPHAGARCEYCSWIKERETFNQG